MRRTGTCALGARSGRRQNWPTARGSVKLPKLITITVAFSLSCLAVPALAETAHNAQAGANGGTSNNCSATAYFPEGTGCLSSEVSGMLDQRDGAVPSGAAVGRSRALRPPSGDE